LTSAADHADQLGADWYQQAGVTSGDARYTAEVTAVRGGSRAPSFYRDVGFIRG
jgi:hypothetical protein